MSSVIVWYERTTWVFDGLEDSGPSAKATWSSFRWAEATVLRFGGMPLVCLYKTVRNCALQRRMVSALFH